MIHHLKNKTSKERSGSYRNSLDGGKCKKMSETVKTTVYPDNYFSNFKFELLPFVSIRRETDNRTVSYCKNRYKSVYRYIDTALVLIT